MWNKTKQAIANKHCLLNTHQLPHKDQILMDEYMVQK